MLLLRHTRYQVPSNISHRLSGFRHRKGELFTVSAPIRVSLTITQLLVPSCGTDLISGETKLSCLLTYKLAVQKSNVVAWCLETRDGSHRNKVRLDRPCHHHTRHTLLPYLLYPSSFTYCTNSRSINTAVPGYCSCWFRL